MIISLNIRGHYYFLYYKSANFICLRIIFGVFFALFCTFFMYVMCYVYNFIWAMLLGHYFFLLQISKFHLLQNNLFFCTFFIHQGQTNNRLKVWKFYWWEHSSPFPFHQYFQILRHLFLLQFQPLNWRDFYEV